MITEYQTQNMLNPKLWVADQLKPGLQDKFMKIADYFYDTLETDTDVYDVVLIGSNANYNWTEYSDIDLHVIINYLQVGDNLHLVDKYLRAKKSIWNANYPLTYQGMNIELYAQDSNDDLHSSVGIYSVMRGEWIRKPSADLVTIDDDLIKQKADPYAYEIDKLDPSSNNLEIKIKDILKRLRNLRRTGLEAAGEYSLENLAYKHLRNSGHLARLKELLQQTTLGQLDINESVVSPLINHITKKQILDGPGWELVMKQTNGIEDANGQWQHPGRCTMIPSNRITMRGVPHKVLGIDDTGHMQLMHPEQEYEYPGGKVFEIPITPQYRTWAMQLLNAIKNGSRYAK